MASVADLGASLLPTELDALVARLSAWQTQEYIGISFFTIYVHYVLWTMEEEVRIIGPQKWSRGKLLFVAVRYGMLVYSGLALTINFRNYLTISSLTCKIFHVTYHVVYSIVSLACNFALGVCICALLQARTIVSSMILFLSVTLPLISAIFVVVPSIQFPAIPRTPLDEALGYPCSYVTSDQWTSVTIANVGQLVRSYINLAVGVTLPALACITIIVRYGRHRNQIVKVLYREGGLYSLTLLGLNLSNAIISTPGVVSGTDIDNSILFVLIGVSTDIIMPILVQRLMLSVREIGQIGSETLASTLLFAPLPPDLGSSFDTNSSEMAMEPYRSGGSGDSKTVIGDART